MSETNPATGAEHSSRQSPVVLKASDFVTTDSALEIAEFVERSPTDMTADEQQTYEPNENDPIGNVPRFPNPLRHPLLATGWVIRTLFGILTLILLLAVAAAIPIINFFVLGYLLEVEGRVARSGQLRRGFVLLDRAPQIGTIVIGMGFWLLVIMLISGAASDAALIDPSGESAVFLRGFRAVTGALIVIHLCLAVARGGGLGCFFRPIKNIRAFMGRMRGNPTWQQAGRRVGEFFAGFRLKHHFSLGIRGFVGGLAWLVLPTALFAAADRSEGPAMLITVLGGLLLIPVLSWVPFLQARFAAENRLRSMFELRATRELFTHAPLAWLIALVVIYVLSLPMYLLTVVLPPRDAMWLVTLVFLVSIYPARVVTGWAYHRAVRRPEPAGRIMRWISRSLIAPLLGLYVFLLYFTQFIGAHGKGVLFEHHALLLPVPF